MTSLVEGLLLLARSDEGSLLPASGPTDLTRAARAVVDSVQASSPRLALSTRNPASVAVPPVYLERMITNLVDNARRFAASRVDVEIDSEAGQALLVVSDDGPGVPESARTRIFERFVRLDDARDRGEGGFGLGLAIVSDLCRFYGGTIEVQAAHPGARFVVRFPLHPDAPEPVSSEPEPGSTALDGRTAAPAPKAGVGVP
jgi:signal transduction histidine kinase